MEKEKEESLLKSRSARACTSAGFRLYMGSFRRIFRYTWVAALVLAIINGLFEAFYVAEYPQLLIALQTRDANMLQLVMGISSIMSAGSTLVFVAQMLFLSYGFSMLYHHSTTVEMPWTKRILHIDGATTWRTAKAVLWMLAIGIVIGIVIAVVAIIGKMALSPMAMIASTTLVTLVIAVFLIPIIYVIYKYVLTPKLHFHTIFGTCYKTGLRHLGFLFVVVLVTAIICALAWLLTSIPAIILYVANIQAQTGLLTGDPLGMPSHMTWLTIIVFIMASFLQAYIYLSALFPLYYAYGSIEAGEQEKKSAFGLNNEK